MHNSHSDKRFEGDKAWMGTSKVLQQSSRRQPHVGSTTSASEKVLTMSGKRHVAAEPYRMAFFDQFPSAIAEDARAALSPLKTTARAPATSGSGSGSGSTRPTRGERDFDIISNTQRASSVSHTAQQDEQVLAKVSLLFCILVSVSLLTSMESNASLTLELVYSAWSLWSLGLSARLSHVDVSSRILINHFSFYDAISVPKFLDRPTHISALIASLTRLRVNTLTKTWSNASRHRAPWPSGGTVAQS